MDSSDFELSEITKNFGPSKVLSDLNLGFRNGDFALLLGANGSGKSTLLRICVGLCKPDSGSLLVSGEKLKHLPYNKMTHVGHALYLYGALTVRENLALFASLTRSKVDLNSYLERWNLADRAELKVSELSKGLQFRVSVARALLHTPTFLFLDEPTSSLDDQSTALLAELLSAHLKENGGFVAIATHDLQRLRNHCNRVVVLDQTKIAADSAKDGATLESVLTLYSRINR